MSAYSGPDNLVFRSMTVIERGTVRTYLASLEDLTLNVMGVSSAADSSAMVGLVVAVEENGCRVDRWKQDGWTILKAQSAFVLMSQ